jgi:hypothetical protein
MQSHGTAATEADIDVMYRAFTPLQMEAIKAYATPLEGRL